jgi:SET domain-containing protein
MGVFAREHVDKGERLMVWGGAIVTLAQLRRLPVVLQQHSVQVEEDLYLASVIPDDDADYINHSCDPNAGLNGQIVIVALRDIAPGEEICFDYAMSDSSAYDEFQCECGAATCRGRVSGDDWMLPELQERYRGYFSPYLQRRIEALNLAVHDY